MRDDSHANVDVLVSDVPEEEFVFMITTDYQTLHGITDAPPRAKYERANFQKKS